LRDVSSRVPLVWPVHPRSRANIERFGFAETIAHARIRLLDPQGYLEMLGLLADARLVLTDSGGIQEETTALSVPCLTMRENTERPITISEGTNTLVGRSSARAMACVDEILQTGGKQGRIPELWDGHAAERIAAHLQSWLRPRSVAVEPVCA
jgi:UDP-N-acetylglucosamine 2-epimerase (non-hydrolysing)